MQDLLDSTIVIDHLNGIAVAGAFIASSEAPAISIITWIEVMAGLAPGQAESAGRWLLKNLELLSLSESISEEAVKIRRLGRLKLPDAIILATARSHGLRLVTRNTKDFRPEDDDILVPYRL